MPRAAASDARAPIEASSHDSMALTRGRARKASVPQLLHCTTRESSQAALSGSAIRSLRKRSQGQEPGQVWFKWCRGTCYPRRYHPVAKHQSGPHSQLDSTLGMARLGKRCPPSLLVAPSGLGERLGTSVRVGAPGSQTRGLVFWMRHRRATTPRCADPASSDGLQWYRLSMLEASVTWKPRF